MVKVSIIVPIYNVDKYLGKCLESLINQTLKDIEIICVDDGSVDNSLKILEKYAQQDKRIKVISKSNSGVSDARNMGLENAIGEYIGFIDPDDWIDLDYYEKLYSQAIKYNCDIAVADIKRVINNKQYISYTTGTTQIVDDYYKKLVICDVPDHSYVVNKIYKNSELKKYNMKFESGMYYEDLIFSPQILFYLKKLVTVPNVYYYYLKRKNSILTSKSHKKDLYRASEIAVKFIESKNVPIEKVKTIIKRFKFLGLTILKIKQKYSTVEVKLFNCITWKYITEHGESS